MFKSAMEIHDSTLESKTVTPAGDMVLVFSAYVHRSTGNPGVDAGSVTREQIEVRVESGRFEGESPVLPCRIEEGQGEYDNESFVNLLPAPMGSAEPFEIELLAITGEEFRITGARASVTILSRPAFIDLETVA